MLSISGLSGRGGRSRGRSSHLKLKGSQFGMQVYLAAAWNAVSARKTFIAGTAALAFVVAAVMVSLADDTYEAEVVLVASSFQAPDDVDSLVPSAYPAKAYEDLLLSTTVVGAAHNRLIEANAWADTDPPELVAFRDRLTVEIEILDDTTRPVNFSPFIVLKAQFKSPGLARQAADTWAKVAIETSRRATELRIAYASEVLAQQEQEYLQELNAAWEAQAREEAEWNLNVLRKQLDERVTRIENQESIVISIEKDRAGTVAALSTMEESLAQEKPVIDLFRAPSNDVFWLQGPTLSESDQLDDLLRAGMRDEMVNSIYVQLMNEKYDAQKKIARSDAELSSTRDAMARMDEERKVLQEQIAEHNFIQKRLDLRSETLRRLYTDVARLSLLAEAGADLATRDTESGVAAVGLNRLDANTYTVLAVGPLGKGARVVLATVLGLMLAAAYVAARALAPIAWDNLAQAVPQRPSK